MSVLTHTLYFFFFNDTATTEIYTLSLHDALPIYVPRELVKGLERPRPLPDLGKQRRVLDFRHIEEERLLRESRSEEHTSELQSQSNLVCRLLLEKKKKYTKTYTSPHLPLRVSTPA